MPTSARKSSVGVARRGPIKAHLPYRGDQSEVGKKTGLTIPQVERHSDGFEPFEEVLRRMDGLAPPKPKRKKSIAPVVNPEYDEEDGEMSMQLDSPVNNLASMRPPSTPATVKRVGSTSRPVARTSDVDFDRIPSPKPRSQSKASYGAGPSSLSKSTSRRDVEPESDSPDEGGGYDDGGQDNADLDQDDGNGGGFDFDDYGPQESSPSSRRTPKQTSFTQMDQDDDEEEGEEEDEPPEETPTKNKRDKGKGRAVEEEEEEQDDEEVEDDIANGLEDVDQEHYSDDEEEEEEPEVRPKGKKVRLSEAKPRTETRSRGKKENKPYREGVRKSAREHYKPLEWWRGEKLVYGRSDDRGSKILVPQIREIVRIPKEDPLPLGTLGKRKRRARSKSAKDASATPAPAPAVALNPEEGWDEDTPDSCPVLVYGADNLEPVTRRIAWTAKMVKTRPAANADWSFDKIFADGDFLAAGHLVIPPHGRKPSKASKDNTYVFYVVEGAVNLKIHDTSLILATGGMFMVPRGNTYFIENISNRDAKLFFTQARKVAASQEEVENEARQQAAKRALRSSSAGPMGTPGQSNGRARSRTAPVARAASSKA